MNVRDNHRSPYPLNLVQQHAHFFHYGFCRRMLSQTRQAADFLDEDACEDAPDLDGKRVDIVDGLSISGCLGCWTGAESRVVKAEPEQWSLGKGKQSASTYHLRQFADHDDALAGV